MTPTNIPITPTTGPKPLGVPMVGQTAAANAQATAATKAAPQMKPPLDPKIIEECAKRISKLKLELMMRPNTVFYTTILFSLKLRISDVVPTAGVDGVHLFVNPKFFMNLSENQQIGVLCHEILHIALHHISRGYNLDHERFNRAGDYVINLNLKDNGYELPPSCLYDTKYRDKNSEEVYKELKDEDDANGGPPGGGIPGLGSDVMPAPNGMSKTDIQNHATDIVLRAAAQARAMGDKSCGNAPGEVELLLEKILNPKLPWYVILRNFMSDFNKDDYSMHRPNRRFLPDYWLPGAQGEAIKNLTIAVDVSGSVSKEEFSYFVTEIAHIQELMQPEKMTLISFDTKIQNIHVAHEFTNLFKDIKFTGGGGTHPKPVIEWLNNEQPEVALIFTDGCFTMPELHPTIPVIWLINNNDRFESPYGEVIHYDIPRE